MNTLTYGFFWVLAATGVAMLPMRFQFVPGLALLLVAPVLLRLIYVDYGWITLAFCFAAFVSMFRRPLRYFGRRALGQSRDEAMGRTKGGTQ